jgi:cardiolipin synthase A/B
MAAGMRLGICPIYRYNGLVGFFSISSRPGIATVLRAGLRYLFGRRGQRRVRGLRLYYRIRMLVLIHSADAIGKLTSATEVRLWVDGGEAFPRLERLIRRARQSVVIQMFIWKDDKTGRRIAKRLLEAADRGVQVDITKEAVGDFFEMWGDFMSTKKSADALWRRFWSHPKIRVHYATNQDHAKVYVIDDQILLLTGMNIADEYRFDWHDYLVELRGATFVEQYLARRNPPVDAPVAMVMNTEDGRRVRPAVMGLLRGARHAAVIEHCYLSDPEVIDELVALSRRGVRVTVIIPERPDFHHHANMMSVGRLVTEGDSAFLSVLAYPGMIHAKIILIDFNRALLGSANLMKSSLDEMGEVNVLVRGRHRALHKLQETLRLDTLRSRSLSTTPQFLWISRWLAWLGL